MKASELRNMTTEELTVKKDNLKKELFGLRCDLASGRIEKPSRVKQIKREVAKISTMINEFKKQNMK